jgi:hypothetical protein
VVSLNVPEASSPLPTAVIAGKGAQTSSEMPAKISFLLFSGLLTLQEHTQSRFDGSTII